MSEDTKELIERLRQLDSLYGTDIYMECVGALIAKDKRIEELLGFVDSCKCCQDAEKCDSHGISKEMEELAELRRFKEEFWHAFDPGWDEYTTYIIERGNLPKREYPVIWKVVSETKEHSE